MKLIVGLGNPGDKYALTRHNIGFLILEEFAGQNDIRFKSNRRFKALTGEGAVGKENVILAMPQTFMNLSGHSVRSMANWLKINLSDILLVVDDIALEFGALRIRPKGSSGGHKGLGSTIDVLGTNEFSRMRIGIMGRKGIKDCSKYVLSMFTKKERTLLPDILKRSSRACECWARQGVDTAMNKYNGGQG
ncbi:MAG: aminoacyl-tRNA hydrolase [Candidatus Gorgyraea atricola]|nr:aminoacyl-tRNA hydrolase [Candidatus Gorgyraea atricola]